MYIDSFTVFFMNVIYMLCENRENIQNDNFL